MKKLILLSAAFIISVSAYAQNDSTNWNKTNPQLGNNQDSTFNDFADGYVKKDGKMMSLTNGELEPMDSDVTLSNGTLITSTGNYKLAAGTTTSFKEGSHIDMRGKITPSKNFKGIEDMETNNKDMFLIPDSTKIKNN